MLFVLALAAFAPDLDSVSYLWGPDTFYRVHHAYTHTMVGIAAVALLLAGLECYWVKVISFPELVALNLLGCTVHVLGDVIAVWPLPLLWPWSTQDFALRWTGDFDLVVMLVVGLGTGLAATDRLQHFSRWIFGAVSLLLFGYFWWMPGWAGLGAQF